MTRDASMQSLNVKGLFPAGEGAGYAGVKFFFGAKLAAMRTEDMQHG